MTGKNKFLIGSTFFVILTLFAVALGWQFPNLVNVAKADGDKQIYGYAWSDNIGWLSFSSLNCDSDGDGFSNGTNPAEGGRAGCPAEGTPAPSYGVILKGDNTLSGYAWSDNIGWVYFGPTDIAGTAKIADAPGNPKIWAKFDPVADSVVGWAKAIAGVPAKGDWDGWIKMSGTPSSGGAYAVNIDTQTGNFSHWAWGSTAIGWLSFDGVGYNVTTNSSGGGGDGGGGGGGGGDSGEPSNIAGVNLTAVPNPVEYGQNTTLQWYSESVDSCVGSGEMGWTGAKTAPGYGEQEIGPFDNSDPNQAPHSFSIICSGPNGDASDSVNVSVIVDFTLQPDKAGAIYATMVGQAGQITSSETLIKVHASQLFLMQQKDVKLSVKKVEDAGGNDKTSLFAGFNFGDDILSPSDYLSGSTFSVNVPAGTDGIYYVTIEGTVYDDDGNPILVRTIKIKLNVTAVEPTFKEI